MVIILGLYYNEDMGLKFFDTLRLSWSNITGHKGRSASIVISVSLLFGLIAGVSMVLAGVENSILKTITDSDDGVYVRTGILPTADDPYFWEKMPQNADKIVEQRVKEYGGELVGKVTDYEIDRIREVDGEIFRSSIEFHVLSGEFVGETLARNDIEMPEDKIPVLVPKGRNLNEEDEKRFFVVGEFTPTEVSDLTLPGDFNPINLAFNMVQSQWIEMYMLDDGSGVVQRFIDENLVGMEEYGVSRIWNYEVAKFKTAEDATRYYDKSIQDGNKYGYTKDTTAGYMYTINDLFGRTIGVASAFLALNAYVWMFGVVLLLFAICIAALTLQRVIDSEVATVALYRSMGASTGQIYLIYFLYLLELCFLAVISCLMIGLIIAEMMYLSSAEPLAERLQTVYILEKMPKVSFVGFSGMILWVIGGVLIIAPLALAMNMKRFSTKYIARKLKG